MAEQNKLKMVIEEKRLRHKSITFENRDHRMHGVWFRFYLYLL